MTDTLVSSAAIRGILFDKDGTLIDFNRTWLPLYRKAADYLATEAGKPQLASELLRSGGFIEADESWQPDSLLASGSNQQIYEAWSEQLGIDIDSDRLAECYRIFTQKHDGYAAVIDDLNVFFDTLRQRGLKLGVATMDDEASAVKTLQTMGCLDRFDFVCGADSGFGVKPEPGMVEAFCRHCDLSVEQTAMVGDSPRDLKMGRNAGVGLTVGVLTGTTGSAALAENADYIYENISGMLQLFSAAD